MSNVPQALKSAEKARAKGGLATFLCPRRPGDLRLTPTACASVHRLAKLAKSADVETKERLSDCMGCEVGAANAAAGKARKLAAPETTLAARKTVSRQRGSFRAKGSAPATGAEVLEFVRARGRCTATEAAKHFKRHRETIAERFANMERSGLLRRYTGDSKRLWWEVV